jgi:hypothetical protein
VSDNINLRYEIRWFPDEGALEFPVEVTEGRMYLGNEQVTAAMLEVSGWSKRGRWVSEWEKI